MNEPEPAGVPRVGEAVHDTARDRYGRVTEHEGPYLRLRPFTGGREWDAHPDQLRLLPREELLSVLVAEANARSRQNIWVPSTGALGVRERGYPAAMKRIDHLEHLDKQLVDELAQVARETIRDELREQTRRQRRRAALYAASGAVALYAGAAVALALGLALDTALPGWAAALITAAVLGAVAYVLRGAARPHVHPRPGTSPGPEATAAGSGVGSGIPYPPPPPVPPTVPATGTTEPGILPGAEGDDLDPGEPHHRA